MPERRRQPALLPFAAGRSGCGYDDVRRAKSKTAYRGLGAKTHLARSGPTERISNWHKGTRPCATTECRRSRGSGKPRDPETGLDDFGARYNSSTLGRFLTPDPLPWIEWQHKGRRAQERFLSIIADPQALDKYTYVRNNPVSRIDPTGLLDYETMLLGRTIHIHVDDKLSETEQQALSKKLNAAIANINSNAAKLTGYEKGIIGNIRSISIDSSIKRSFVNEPKGAFHLTVGYVNRSSKAWAGSAISHDAYHVQQYKTGGFGSSRAGARSEKPAFQFQLEVGEQIGLAPFEIQYLQGLINDPHQLDQYYASPVE